MLSILSHLRGLLQASSEIKDLKDLEHVLGKQMPAPQLLSSSSRSSSFRILCLLRILQQKLNFADKLPRAFLKIYSFCEKMSLLTFLPPKSMRCSSRCRVCGPELGLAGAVLHQAGLRAAASAIGGSSFQPHPGHASQGGGVKFPSTAALTSPAP